MSVEKNKIVNKIIRFVPVIIMMIVIFAFSAMPGEESSDTSMKFLNPLLHIMEGISHHKLGPDFENSLHWFIRKAAHFSEYAFFGILVLNAFYTKEKTLLSLGVFSEIFVLLYAINDEIHQYFVPGRYAALLDVCIDSSGALLGILVVLLIINSRRKRKRNIETL